MVWCWQQTEDQRPNASEILTVSRTDQFLRLSDAIRVNNFGSQVSAAITIYKALLEHCYYL